MMIPAANERANSGGGLPSTAAKWARQAFTPSPLTIHEWRRWSRPWRLDFWPFHLGLALLWLSPVAVLTIGPNRYVPVRQIGRVMVAVLSLTVALTTQ